MVHPRIRTFIVVFIVFISSLSAFSQDSLKENTVVEVNRKQHQLEQSKWERLISTDEFRICFRITTVGSSNFLDLRISKNNFQPITIDREQKLVFHLANADSVVIKNTATSKSCTGCGSINIVDAIQEGIQVSYFISAYELKQIENNPINKFCVYTNGEKISSFLFPSEYSKILKAIILTQDL